VGGSVGKVEVFLVGEFVAGGLGVGARGFSRENPCQNLAASLHIRSSCFLRKPPFSSFRTAYQRPSLRDRPREKLLSEFAVYFRLGFRHIADLGAYDHMLFIAALTVAYPAAAWRRLVWLVTAFTLGHSVTLALATLDVVRVGARLVELLIPVTIVLTGLAAVFLSRGEDETHGPPGSQVPQYALAAGFGLIHGLGFSNYLRSLLGGEESIVRPLFAFNVGLEIGQLLIVGVVLLLGVLLPRLLRLTRREWVLLVSGGTVAVALTMIAERLRAPVS
jgi:hypothetical protein